MDKPCFNGWMLILARHLRMITLDELADHLAIDRVTLLRYESGAEYPTAEHVKQIAHSLDFPMGFFLRPGRLHPPIGRNVHHIAGS